MEPLEKNLCRLSGGLLAALAAMALLIALGGCSYPGGGSTMLLPPPEKKIDSKGIAVGDGLCNKVTSSVPPAYTGGGITTPYEASTNTFGTEENVTTSYSQKCGVKAKGGEYVPPAGGGPR